MRFAAILAASLACAPAPRLIPPAVGSTPAEVEAALGTPDRRYHRVTEVGELEIWSYLAFHPLFEMPQDAAPGTALQIDGISVPPLQRDERARAVFRNGRLAALERR